MAEEPTIDAKFEPNFRILEKLAKDLESESVGIDELVPRAREGANAAKCCFDVLQQCDKELVEIDRLFTSIAADNRGEGASK